MKIQSAFFAKESAVPKMIPFAGPRKITFTFPISIELNRFAVEGTGRGDVGKGRFVFSAGRA